MKVKQVRALLDGVKAVQMASGAEEASLIISRLSDLLKPYDKEEFSEFVARHKKLQARSLN